MVHLYGICMAGVDYLVSDVSGTLLWYPTDTHINKPLGYSALARAFGEVVRHPFQCTPRDNVRALLNLKKKLEANLAEYDAGHLPLQAVIEPFNQAVLVGQPVDGVYRVLDWGAWWYAKHMDRRILQSVHTAVSENNMGTGIISTSYGAYIRSLLDQSAYGKDWKKEDTFARHFLVSRDDAILGVEDEITGRKAAVFEREFLKKRKCSPATTCFMGDGPEDKNVADLLQPHRFIVPFYATEEFREEMGKRGAFVPGDEKDLQKYLLRS